MDQWSKMINMLWISGKSCVNRERIDKTTNVDQVLVCTEDFCKDHSCIPHCCPAGQYFSGIDSRCIKNSKLKNSLWTEETKLKVKNPKKGQPIPTFIDARTFSCKLTTGKMQFDAIHCIAISDAGRWKTLGVPVLKVS